MNSLVNNYNSLIDLDLNMFQTFTLRPPTDENKYPTKPVTIIPDSFTGLVVGPPGAGKSKFIADLLYNTKGLYKKFDLVLFMVPYVEAFDLDIPEDRLNNTLSIDWMKNKIEEEAKIRPIKNCLVIIDDLVSSISKSHLNPELIDFFFNRRKLMYPVEISIICTTQKFTLFPAKYRSCLQWLTLFQVSADDLKIITKQHLYNPPPHLNTTISAHYRKAYNFIFIKLDKSGIFLNFEKQI